MKQALCVVWFRQDCRLHDNSGLLQAARLGPILPIYIASSSAPSLFAPGGATKLYLHHLLSHFNQALQGCLNLYTADCVEVFKSLMQRYAIQKIFWNRSYEPWALAEEQALEGLCIQEQIPYSIGQDSYLFEPKDLIKEDGSYYKVFGAYKRRAFSYQPRAPLPAPRDPLFVRDTKNPTTLDDLALVPTHPWGQGLSQHIYCGEQAAHDRLKHFLNQGVWGYKEGRDYPAQSKTSGLSAHLHFGEISPHQIWHAVLKYAQQQAADTIKREGAAEDTEHFLTELLWREFSCYLLYHFKGLPEDNVQARFNAFPWGDDRSLLKAWQSGQTGHPLVDAGMRELWQTGYMHNRVRMVVASFLVKNLMIHWHHGRDWFWDCLFDADLANNSASWQWVAGSGVDAAPYFRIFNPTTQGERYDSQGLYTRRFVPELALLPDKYLFKPWEAPAEILQKAGIVLGKHYPYPIIDLKSSRENALSAYHRLR